MCVLYSMTSNEVVIMGRHTVHLMVCSYWIFPADEICVRISLEKVLGVRWKLNAHYAYIWGVTAIKNSYKYNCRFVSRFNIIILDYWIPLILPKQIMEMWKLRYTNHEMYYFFCRVSLLVKDKPWLIEKWNTFTRA